MSLHSVFLSFLPLFTLKISWPSIVKLYTPYETHLLKLIVAEGKSIVYWDPEQYLYHWRKALSSPGTNNACRNSEMSSVLWASLPLTSTIMCVKILRDEEIPTSPSFSYDRMFSDPVLRRSWPHNHNYYGIKSATVKSRLS